MDSGVLVTRIVLGLLCCMGFGNAAFGFFGMNTGAFMQSSMPTKTSEVGAANTVPPNTNAYGVAVDSLSNVYATGYTLGGLDGNVLSGARDAFVTKYNSSGTRLWTHHVGGAAGTNTLKFRFYHRV